MIHFNQEKLDTLHNIFKINLINSCSGYKPANLIATVSNKGIENVAIFSSIVHIGSNPPLLGFIVRPSGEVPRNTYKNILERIGLDYKIVAADSGSIGGDTSEEFHVLAETGEDTIAISSESEFAINTELLLKEGEDISSLEGKPSPDGKGTIQIKKGIEVGHIFQLGKVYAEDMKANVLNNEGKASTLHIGCYGVGVSRLVAAAIEQNNDDKGIIWPHSISPFDINIIAIGYEKDQQIAEASIKLYKDLQEMGYEVLLDDRKDGYGTKMKDSELIGIPLNIVIGKQYIETNEVELKSRSGDSSLNDISNLKTILDFFK